ncbi:MAG: hypothetical protein HY320_00605 [Armatimonadetes bacterium]|nr:hypothetical protein [Armatimonadota bacterium]
MAGWTKEMAFWPEEVAELVARRLRAEGWSCRSETVADRICLKAEGPGGGALELEAAALPDHRPGGALRLPRSRVTAQWETPDGGAGVAEMLRLALLRGGG